MRNLKTINEGKKEQILKLRDNGYSYRDIQKEYGFSKGTISYHCGEGQKEKTKIRSEKSVPARRELRSNFLYDLKSKTPCAHCGKIVDPSCLDYHHLDRNTKKEPVSVLVRGNWSIEIIQKEIDKCDALCSNCHRIEESEITGDNNAKRRNSKL